MKKDLMYRSLDSIGQTVNNRLAKSPPEEPDALIAHVRVCEGPGRRRPGLLGNNAHDQEMMKAHSRLGRESALDGLRDHPQPAPVFRAVLGIKDDFGETGVNWDGSLLAIPLHRLKEEKLPPEQRRSTTFGLRLPEKFYLGFGRGVPGRKAEPVGADPEATRRQLIDGWLPGVVVRYHSMAQNLHYEQTLFTAAHPNYPTIPLNMVRLRISNPGDCRRESLLVARFGWQTKDGRPLIRQCIRRGGWLLDPEGFPILRAPPPLAFTRGPENRLTFRFALNPGESRNFDFLLPRAVLTGREAAFLNRWPFATALRAFRRYWKTRLAPGLQIRVPDRRINDLYRNLLAQCFIAADGDIMYYGAYPSGYDNAVFGVEEGFVMLALAYWGFGRDAQRYLTQTYLDPRYLRQDCANRLWRNGLSISYALECFRLMRKPAWLTAVLPVLQESGEWIMAERRTTMTHRRGANRYWGLLPRASLGGDLGNQTGYPLHVNAACWRGLRDLGLALQVLGRGNESRACLASAADFKRCIRAAVRKAFRADLRPPFLPLNLADRRTRRTPPVRGNYDILGDYYQVIAPGLLTIGLFGCRSHLATSLARYMKESGRLFFGLPRIWGGVDPLYGKGYYEWLLQTGRVGDFLEALEAYLRFCMDPDVFTLEEVTYFELTNMPKVVAPAGKPETAGPPVETDRAYSNQRRTCLDLRQGSEPCMGGTGVLLQSLRRMLVMEEKDEADLPTGRLLLAAGIPRTWLADGQTIEVRQAPTYYGTITYLIQSAVARREIRALIDPPPAAACPVITLTLRHPACSAIRGVRVNGRPLARSRIGKESLRLNNPGHRLEITLHYT